MGSTGNRKPSDTVRIKPIQSIRTGSGNGSSGGNAAVGGNSPDINNMCPIRFRIKLARQDLMDGVELSLDNGALVAPDIGEVGKTDTRITKRLEACSGLGINYATIITVIDQGTCYAEFAQ